MTWRARLHTLFTLDLRSLALFRVGLGMVLLLDLIQRALNVRAFYSDAGVLPRSALTDLLESWRFSLHLASGNSVIQMALMLVAILAALALLCGYRARLAALVSWALLASLDTRNPLVLTTGDTLMVCLLFWALFLPIGARWSVDAAWARTPPPLENTHRSWASAALILQVLSVYVFSALMSTGVEWWPDGTALYYTLHLDRLAWNWAQGLLDFPLLMQGLSLTLYGLACLAPLLALSPVLTQPLRLIALLLLASLNLGLLSFLALGPLPWVNLVALTALLGSHFWDWAGRGLTDRTRLAIYHDGECGFCLRLCRLLTTFLVLPGAMIHRAQDHPRAYTLLQANKASWLVIDHEQTAHLKGSALVALLRVSPLFRWMLPLLNRPALPRLLHATYDIATRHTQGRTPATHTARPGHDVRWSVGHVSQTVAGGLMLIVLAWNAATVGWLPSATLQMLSPLLHPLRLDQSWGQSAPSKNDGWFVLPGTRTDGQAVDALRPDQPPSFTKPDSIAAEHSLRWRTYQSQLYEAQNASQLAHWAAYLCREWNRDAAPAQQLHEFKIVYMLERTPPPGGPFQIEQSVLWRHQCND